MDLNERANRLAHHLIGLGVVPDMRVVICVERSIAMIVGMLAILKAGGAYVPLDPTYPAERLIRILRDAAPDVILIDAMGHDTLNDAGLHRLSHSTESLGSFVTLDPNEHFSSSSTNPLIPDLTSSQLAYVTYTSGSTGNPKGVMIEHQGVVNHIVSRLESHGLDNSSRVLQFTSLSFDVSVLEIFAALFSGASLYVLQDHIRRDLSRLWNFLQQHCITQASLTPALFQGCKDLPPLSIALNLTLAGEALPLSLLRRIQPLLPKGSTITNEYGPTEATIIATIWTYPTGFTGSIVPIGRPIANKTIYILDKHCQPVPLGVVGELYIGGVGVARGYLNRQEMTAKVFLQDPFAGDSSARMYKTGDMARYLPDGNIVFLGRNDHQVKIRGFRIELGEIEARLTDHPAVNKAVVIATYNGNDKRLVAYVVAEPDDRLVDTLRTHLASSLPDYMIPAAIVRLNALPLNSNGKLDRNALPAPDSSAFAHQEYEPPQGEIEMAIARIWTELLHLDRVSRNDNFFVLGGHSLLAVRMVNRIATLGVQFPLSTLFTSPRLSSLAECVSQSLDYGYSSLSVITPVSREDDMPLSFSQQRLWFISQLEGVSRPYHIPLAVRFRGNLDCQAWQHALNTLFARHESLRSVFVAVDGLPLVRFLPVHIGIPIRWEDLRGVPEADVLLERIITEESNISFDLAQGPLIRALMVQLDANEHVFMLTQHHIVSDGWSMAILHRELSVLYNSYCRGEPDTLPSLTIQYPDYAAWQRQWLSGDRLEAHTSYWRTTLSDAPVLLNLPLDRPRPSQQLFEGDQIPFSLDPQLTSALKQLCQEHGVTLYMVILSAWSAVLSRLSGQDDIIVGSPTANRNHQQIEHLIGFFVNSLALRIDLSGDPTIRQLLERVRSSTLEAQAHQDVPFEQVVDIVQPPRSLSHSPLFQVMFVWQNNEPPEWQQLRGLEADDYVLHLDTVKFDIELQLYESKNEIHGSLGYSTSLFDRSTMDRHVGYLCAMLQAMVKDMEQAVSTVDLLAPEERDLLLWKWNETQQDYPSQLCVHHLFEQQVELTPQATALVFMDESLTYMELNERANRLAHHLIGLGVLPDMCVAICVERSLAMIIGVLAILKAGGAYVPLDPVYASGRLKDILVDVAPAVVVADESGQEAIKAILSSTRMVDLHVLESKDGSISITPYHLISNPQVPGLTSRHLAYVIYTSGSTGMPKGVMIEHQGIVNLVKTRPSLFGTDSASRIMQFFSFGFDGCVLDIFMTLGCGGSLHILPDRMRSDSVQMWNYLESHSMTQTTLTPTILQSCRNLPPLSTALTLIVAGEALTAELLRGLQLFVSKGRIVNDYGPTETTISAITWKCPNDFHSDIVPIGRPIANKKIYILDKHGEPAPLGAVGELYIGGIGVARGYLNRPEMTAKAFLPDPFADDPNARMYKTGDMARYLPDGNIVFLGRNDHQVKIRGFRIELGEIEARLTDHRLVDKAVVIATGGESDKRLIAYVVAEPNDRLVDILRTHLLANLLDYMIPAAIVRLDVLPLNSNGKLDHKALPAPDTNAFAHQEYEPPQYGIETTVAQIWTELLHLDRVSRNDNFFALGGHSLLAVRLMNRIAALGVQLPLSALFTSPRLSSFAECVIQHQESSLSVISPASRENDLLLSFSQQRLWFISQLEGVSRTYHIPLAVRFRGNLDREAWQHALNTLFARHESLRSVFVAVDGLPLVRFLPAHIGIPIRWEDVSGADVLLERIITEEANISFDLAQGPLIRALMVQLDANEHVFMLTQHHIVSDGWSMAILHRELSLLYNSSCRGEPDTLPPLTIQYHDYAAWQRQWLSGDRLEAHTSYWRTTLSDAPVLLNLPLDRPRPSQQLFEGDQIPFSLDPQLTSALKQLCQEQGVTLYMVILSAWSAVLSRLSGQDDIIVGSPTANRNHQQIEHLIGFFVNSLALRIDLSGDPTIRQLLERVRSSTLEAQAHQDVPFEQVVDIVQPPRSLSHSPLFQVMFVWQNNETPEWQLRELEADDYGLQLDTVKFDIELQLYESKNEIHGSLGYSTSLFDRSTMVRHVGYLCAMLQAIVKDVEQAASTVDLLAPEERDLLLWTWNETQQDYPSQLCVHHLFEQQVERIPQAIALVFMDESLSYMDLNERANRLSHHLIGLGVVPDMCVAICVERSLAMVIGVLAILKAGGAYVPLDPAYASGRLQDIIADVAPSVVIVDEPGRTAIGDGVLSSIQVVDSNAFQADRVPDRTISGNMVLNPRIQGLTSRHLAYVIYTSGSTGRPKGVMIEHQDVVNLVTTRSDVYGICPSSRVAQFFSFGFDGFALDIFMTLCLGGNLHLLTDSIRSDPTR
ncbi:hypothetical protein BGZ65_001860, partial [Modicella reniformis]